MRTGLRTHDVHQGLVESPADRATGVLATELDTTQLVGMAAALATWLKGQNVVADAQKLRYVADQQLGISPFVFDAVVGLLEELGFVWQVERPGGRIRSFNESVRLLGTFRRPWRRLA